MVDINTLKWHELREKVEQLNLKLQTMGAPYRIIPWNLGLEMVDEVPTNLNIVEPIKAITYSALVGGTSLESISLPSTLKIIGEKAFYRCLSLTKIDIPYSVRTIGKDAFYNCVALEEVIIHNRRLDLSKTGINMSIVNLVEG